MKIIYEKGDKVIIPQTGAHTTVLDVVEEEGHAYEDGQAHPGWTKLILANGRHENSEDVRPVLDTAVLLGEMGKVQRIFLGLPNTFLQEPGDSEVMNLADYYNQSYQPDDEADYEVVWCQTLADVTAAIKEANGDDVQEAKDDAVKCDECGNDMVVEDGGISHHLDPEGGIDHAQDADHVAYNRDHQDE